MNIIGGITMTQDAMDQGWQKIQDRVEQVMSKYLRGGLHEIEHKPTDGIHLLENREYSQKDNT
jgi:hypothetical protein